MLHLFETGKLDDIVDRAERVTAACEARNDTSWAARELRLLLDGITVMQRAGSHRSPLVREERAAPLDRTVERPRNSELDSPTPRVGQPPRDRH